MIAVAHVHIKTTQSKERSEIAPSKSSNVSGHLTDPENTKQETNLRLTYPMIMGQPHLRAESTKPMKVNKKAPS